MAELVTLESLLSADPVATDNSSPQETAPGTTSDPASSPPEEAPAGDVSRRIAELENLVHRHREQISGNVQEVTRYKERIEQLEHELTRRLREGTHGAPEARSQPPERLISLAEATQKLLLDNDDSLLRAYEQQQQARTGVTTGEVQRVLEEFTEKQRQQAQAQAQVQEKRTMILQTLGARHPELSDMEHHPTFVQAMNARYQELAADAMRSVLYPTDATYDFVDPRTGATWDLRIVLQAADQVKARGVKEAPPTLGSVAGATPSRANGRSGPHVPKNYVSGDQAVFQDPTMKRYLASRGWGDTTGKQVETMFKWLPKSTKERIGRGEI